MLYKVVPRLQKENNGETSQEYGLMTLHWQNKPLTIRPKDPVYTVLLQL